MKNRIKTIVIAAVSVMTLGAFAPSAKAGGCSIGGGRISIDFGHRGNSHYSHRSSRGYYNSGYSGHYHRPSYRDTCSLIDTCYFTRGCHRYAKYTYLHRRIDCNGRVVRCWRTYKTVCLGRYH